MRKILVLKVVDNTIKIMDDSQVSTALKYSSYRLLTDEEKERVCYGPKGPSLLDKKEVKQVDCLFGSCSWCCRIWCWIKRLFND